MRDSITYCVRDELITKITKITKATKDLGVYCRGVGRVSGVRRRDKNY